MPRKFTHNLIWKQQQLTSVFISFDTFLLEAHQLKSSLTSSLWYQHCGPQKENHHLGLNASFFATKRSTIALFGVQERTTQQITPVCTSSQLTNCLRASKKKQKSTRNSSFFFIKQSDPPSRSGLASSLALDQ